jgi:galactokinase
VKKDYKAPTLMTHGSIESVTQYLGNSARKDFLFFSAAPGQVDIIGESTGSVDLIVKPCNVNAGNCK